MCYAIPGKVIELADRLATVDYYGERKKAYTDLLDVKVGDYVYAQGGFLIQKVSFKEAQEILADWKELFFRLQETDKNLTTNPKNLYERANAIRQKHQGNSCCVHGILEFSNYCRCNCLYCGIRRDNKALQRYRMEIPQILESVEYAVKLGFKALVLQSGEDQYYDDDKLYSIVKQIRDRYPVLLFVSIGERSLNAYKRLYDAGARGVLMRFETSNPKIYAEVKPESSLEQRLKLLNDLREMGYLIITGFLVGLPGEKAKDILKSIKLTASLAADKPSGEAGMFSFGPFIPHPQTPLATTPRPTIEKMLKIIAKARIMNPDARILVTTALETLDKENAARDGLMAGANSLMINVTPPKYRKLYDIYPQRFGTDLEVQEHINRAIELLKSLGRAPTDLSV
ncbi:MAG: [FeFe] hydrogenase H-cluster radical SAM maturase HydE [Planctomycetes bacterium]|nr:[FeFe] hydrogenase H-cluster radical SAM maturase HydE [Planctomycetota bacterium]